MMGRNRMLDGSLKSTPNLDCSSPNCRRTISTSFFRTVTLPFDDLQASSMPSPCTSLDWKSCLTLHTSTCPISRPQHTHAQLSTINLSHSREKLIKSGVCPAGRLTSNRVSSYSPLAFIHVGNFQDSGSISVRDSAFLILTKRSHIH